MSDHKGLDVTLNFGGDLYTPSDLEAVGEDALEGGCFKCLKVYRPLVGLLLLIAVIVGITVGIIADALIEPQACEEIGLQSQNLTRYARLDTN